MSPNTTRRIRTARKIQATAVDLAARHGLANVTIDEIARDAGISTRTFFNYYPYKEAALMGPPPDYPVEASERFVTGTGPLIRDLERLIAAHLSRYLSDREMVGHIHRLAATDPKVSALYSSSVLARRAQMRELLGRRMPATDRRLIEILAAAIVGATNAATTEWISSGRDDFVAIAHEHLALILPAAGLLSAEPSG
ncbi:TetR/AcrR family transcriptional regulator [Paracoccus spongiarum]|uniref:TetR/AcrR family transcriptional regulator n=1 Tax=Paracoccus spongiarum TaxID=3064387 RepID=A0ABT9JGB7_9RHOB|nr:TetR/AcrR family transcriptional regulator [Paracoccus sp. 2205BS29-5]MDP5308117.1 TetR/AcrR family transcriptional regulator [Paracoccus sp. 2205BS29-5]